MRAVISSKFDNVVQTQLSKVGYIYHCKVANQICFHRTLHAGRFPRFHLLVTPAEDSYAIDLHIDQYSMERKGNHGEAWAYTGVRVHEEINRVAEFLKSGKVNIRKINQASLGFVDTTTRNNII
jgi:hypothetical protein